MRRSGVSFLLLMFVLGVMISGCGSGDGQAGSGDKGSGTPPANSAGETKPAANSGPVDITVFTSGGETEDSFNQKYGDAIRKKFPNVNLKFIVRGKGTEIQDLIAAKTPLDIVYESIGQFHGYFQKYGLATDISDMIKTHNYDLTKLEPTLVELQRKLANGGIYGLPVWIGASGLYYNKDIFDKFGIGYPKDGMTWTQVYELAKKLTRADGGVQYYGYMTSPSHQMATNQLSLDPVDPKTETSNFNSDPWKKFMQSIVQFFTIPGYDLDANGLSVAGQRALFEKDFRAAMWTNYSGGTPPENMNWDVVTVPTYEEARDSGPQVYPNYWYVTSISQHKDVAFDIIAYLTSEEFQIPFNRQGFPTSLKNPEIQKQFGQDLPKFQGKNVASMFPKTHAMPMNYTPYHDIAQSQFQAAFTDIVLGKKDMNTALRDAAEATDKAISERKAAQK